MAQYTQMTPEDFWFIMAERQWRSCRVWRSADDQLTLAPANGDHAVHRQDTGLQRSVHRSAVHNGGSGHLHRTEGMGIQRQTVQGTADGVDDPAQQFPAHADVRYPAGAPGHTARRYAAAAQQTR